MARFLHQAILTIPSVEWFNFPVTHQSGSASVPGTPEAGVMSEFGQIAVPQNQTLNYVHLHQIEDGSGGTSTLELHRLRSGVWTQIASITLAQGGGDFQQHSWTITDAELLARDYLFMQASSLMTGKGVGFVDLHFAPVPI